jgi:hypothetical protein
MALPVYVRDKIALDVTEQRENAAARSQGHAVSGAARAGA